MKPRSHCYAAIALLLLSTAASAQTRRGTALASAPAAAPATQTVQPIPGHAFGSFERTKLLQKGGTKAGGAVVQLGAVDRRVLLTTGKSVYPPKPKRSYSSRR